MVIAQINGLPQVVAGLWIGHGQRVHKGPRHAVVQRLEDVGPTRICRHPGDVDIFSAENKEIIPESDGRTETRSLTLGEFKDFRPTNAAVAAAEDVGIPRIGNDDEISMNGDSLSEKLFLFRPRKPLDLNPTEAVVEGPVDIRGSNAVVLCKDILTIGANDDGIVMHCDFDTKVIPVFRVARRQLGDLGPRDAPIDAPKNKSHPPADPGTRVVKCRGTDNDDEG